MQKVTLALVLLGLASAAVAVPAQTGITELLPQAQLEEYFDGVAAAAKAAVNSQIPIKDVAWGIDSLFGVPFKFKITTKNGRLSSPTEVRRSMGVAGTQEMSGTAHISGTLYLGQLAVEYDQVSFNIFGLELAGKLKAHLYQAYLPVNLHIYKNAMTDRKAVAYAGELQGLLTLRLGSDSYFQQALDVFLDLFCNLTAIRRVFVSSLFDSIARPIENAISHALSVTI